MFDKMGKWGQRWKTFCSSRHLTMFKQTKLRQHSMCYCVNYNDDNRVIVAVTVSALMIMHPEFVY